MRRLVAMSVAATMALASPILLAERASAQEPPPHDQDHGPLPDFFQPQFVFIGALGAALLAAIIVISTENHHHHQVSP